MRLTQKQQFELFDFVKSNDPAPDWLVELYRYEMPYEVQTGESGHAHGWLIDRLPEIERRFESDLAEISRLIETGNRAAKDAKQSKLV